MTMRTRGARPALALLAALLLAAALTSGARAQGGMDALKSSTPKERATIQPMFMKSKLALSEEQASKVSALNLEYAEKAEPIIKGDSGPFAKRRQMNELQDQKDAQLEGVLTPDQFTKYEASREEMRDKMLDAISKRLEKGGS